MVNHEFFLITTKDESWLQSSFNNDSMYDSNLQPLTQSSSKKNQKLSFSGWCGCY